MRFSSFTHGLLAAAILCTPLGAAAQSQSGLGKFLNKVNQDLQGVNQALSGNGAAGGRSAPTGFPIQSVEPSQHKSANSPEVEFLQGLTTERVVLFNEALPVIDKTVGMIGCIRYHSFSSSEFTRENGREWEALHPYLADGEAIRRPGYLYGTPMGQMSYHDEHSCLAVSNVGVSVRAANALEVRIKFLAADSGETTDYAYAYRKNYKGIWQLASYERLSN